MELLVGADPEVFLRERRTGKFVAALHIPGTKEEPHKLDGGAIQRDGFALEFNIDPAKSSKEFASNIANVYEQCKQIAGDDYELCPIPAVHFDEDYYNSLSDDIKAVGCQPDFSATTGSPTAPPKQLGTWRMGGGHIHIGWGKDMAHMSEDHINDCSQLIHRLDTYFQLFMPIWDRDITRRTMYGGAKNFRPKPYGVEYRVPSNAWLSKPEIWPWLFDSVQWVFNRALLEAEGKAKYDLSEYIPDPVYNRTNDTAGFNSLLKDKLSTIFGSTDCPPFSPALISSYYGR